VGVLVMGWGQRIGFSVGAAASSALIADLLRGWGASSIAG
jgi:hypothetical protein